MQLHLDLPDADETVHLHARRSRRAGGPVLDLDLAPNRGCNWACVYCDTATQKAEGPDIDQGRLRAQLEAALEQAAGADFADGDALAALLVAGSGEPTHCFDLAPSLETLAAVLGERGLAGSLQPVLVTNGERLSERRSRAGLATLTELGGSIWYKLDTATREGLKELNRSDVILRAVRNHLRVAAETLPTWIQTCVFDVDGSPSLDEAGRAAYVALIESQLSAKVPLRGVQLYSPNRPSPDGRVSAPDEGWVRALATELEQHLPVSIHL